MLYEHNILLKNQNLIEQKSSRSETDEVARHEIGVHHFNREYGKSKQFKISPFVKNFTLRQVFTSLKLYSLLFSPSNNRRRDKLNLLRKRSNIEVFG